MLICEAIKMIIERKGDSAFDDSKRFMAMLDDLSPEEQDIRRVMRVGIDDRILSLFKSGDSKTICINRAKAKEQLRYKGLSEKWIETILFLFSSTFSEEKVSISEYKENRDMLKQNNVMNKETNYTPAGNACIEVTGFSDADMVEIQEMLLVCSSYYPKDLCKIKKYENLVDKNVDLLIRWLEKQQDVKLLTELGDIFFTGGYSDKSYERAHYLWNKAIDLAKKTGADKVEAEIGLYKFFSPLYRGIKEQKNPSIAKSIGIFLSQMGKFEIFMELLKYADEYNISKAEGESLFEQIEQNAEPSIDKFLGLIKIYCMGIRMNKRLEIIKPNYYKAENYYIKLKKNDIKLIDNCLENKVDVICRMIELYSEGLESVIFPDNGKVRYWYSELKKMDSNSWKDQLNPFWDYLEDDFEKIYKMMVLGDK